MIRFWQDAVQVMETARSASGAGSATDLAVVVGASGGIRIVMQPGWSAEGLRAHHGAHAVYQVTHTAQGISVEGCGAGLSCRLQAHGMRPAPVSLPSAAALYRVIA